jgi:hypothetical protein
VEKKRKVRKRMSQSQSRLRIYVAGPYSPHVHEHNLCIGEVERNVREAIFIGNELMARGHYVFIPHLTHYLANAPNGHQDYNWYESDNTFIDNWANALYYISPSTGADAELNRAIDKGFPIFRKLSEVPEMKESGEKTD